VTEEIIKAKIAEVSYFVVRNEADPTSSITTVCFIIMRNGFRFIGHSTPASPENFNEEVGRFYAYENAYKQIWPHEGYLLREILWQRANMAPIATEGAAS
jgi:hypothetical protein